MGQTAPAATNGTSLRERITTGLKDAMRDKDKTRLSTLRLINAAIKDQDIAARAKGGSSGVGEDELLAILAKMVKQRQESARAYEEGGRLELAEKERAEIEVIEAYLPRQLDDDEIAAAVDAALAQTGAETLRDMGKVMGVLKASYAGQMDFGAVGPLVKARLS
ncbi:Transamidase GatB domain protein [Roseibacterium elongatum DSM 19469]|uniref:Transamidase GatB domain protein n=1 Tax=Roseicyclus elongatus DSM 19469 TaxID=1294273 RepID=W8S2N5_9RHOB|nr:GatB/YqeY domain-containing protein [Roseibacterium elongatum]AHM04437.1 Transamidase GatB domain protein [Roseibacterium elongatum DSM 19469]